MGGRHGSGTRFKVDGWLFAAAAAAGFAGFMAEYIAVYASIVLHELGHAAAARLSGCRVVMLTAAPFGMKVDIETLPSGRAGRIILYAAGPLVNIALASSGAVLCAAVQSTYCLRFFIVSNLYLAFFNLLPVLPLDGGRMLRELLWEVMGYLWTGRFMRRVSGILAAGVVMCGAVQLAYSRFNFSLILTGLYILLNGKSDIMEDAAMNIKSIMFRRSRILKKGIYGARDLAVLDRVTLSEVVKGMDYDRFHLVYVLDDRLRLLKVFTEQQIMDAIMAFGANTALADVLDKIA